MLKKINLFNSIRKKIFASNGILLLILTFVLMYALSQLHQNQQLLIQEEKAFAVQAEIGEVEETFQEFQLAYLEFILLMQNKHKELRDNRYQQLLSMLEVSHIPEIKALKPELEAYNQQLLSASSAFLDDDKVKGSVLLAQATLQSDKLVGVFNKQLMLLKQEVNSIIESVHKSNTQVSFSLYLLLITLILTGVAVSLFLARLIGNALHSLHKTVEEIEQNGDLTLRAEIKSNDETGMLAAAFNRLVENLANIVQEVAEKSSQLTDAAGQLSNITELTRVGVQNQSDEIGQVATAMNQMSATVSEVATNAEHASNSAQEGDTEANNGSNVVRKTISAIGELAGEVQSSANVIEKLKVDSENIGTVLDVIKNIAEQTNLLALNAAIEAARAGEEGRGFAVVADEVRTLAQRTQESTIEIESLVDALQSGSQQAVAVMRNSQEKAEATVNQAQLAGESLEAITRSVANILNLNTQIASAAEEQSCTAEEINQNVTNIQSISEQTASGADQTASSCVELKNYGEELNRLVAQFKV
ncbi:Methyl-accepting chemotaxis sensor/transducer protein [hydrothermal vent metagenome]|uniref:Methyl-accepting chemotaxis sensor/transducer protein n=1 Tax=hydrothermal vent metagenome TaxID=652676 RepID=A0A3B1AJR0_9ZZZZ